MGDVQVGRVSTLAGMGLDVLLPNEMKTTMKTLTKLSGILTITCIALTMAGCGKKSEASASSHSTKYTKSARQLIQDYGKENYGRGADIEIEGPYAGDVYQVTVRTRIVGGADDGGINDSSFNVTVDESAQQVTSWKLYDHN
jgi:ABC-type glycerol-3-phosphate transport system substrate-binding protein